MWQAARMIGVMALVAGLIPAILHSADEPVAPVLGEDYALDLGEGQTLEFVWIEDLGIWVGKHEVHNGAYSRFNPEHDSGGWEGHALNGERQPVVRVTYFQAEEFAEWLGKQPGLAGTGIVPQLPNGEQWDAIARCGTERRFPWGDDMPPTRGNYRGESIDGYENEFEVTGPVDQVGENEWGLYGVGGNVWEWNSESRQEGRRVLRGGSWFEHVPDRLEATMRLDFDPSYSDGVRTGFRVVLVPAQAED